MNKDISITKVIYILSIAATILCLDQLTKLYIHTHFFHGESVSIIENLFNITYVRNPGAAFGILSDSPAYFRDVFFLIVPLVALVIIFFLLKEQNLENRKEVLSLSLVIGGTLGNYMDRLRLGYVVDFFDFHMFNKYSWPAFNVADVSIVFGVFILLFLTTKEIKNKTS